MLDNHFKKEEFKKSVKENVKMLYRKTIEEATQEQVFQAVSLAVKDVIIDNWLLTQKQYEKDDPKIVYYLSMEFLMGRALGNNLINLCAYDEVKDLLISYTEADEPFYTDREFNKIDGEENVSIYLNDNKVVGIKIAY